MPLDSVPACGGQGGLGRHGCLPLQDGGVGAAPRGRPPLGRPPQAGTESASRQASPFDVQCAYRPSSFEVKPWPSPRPRPTSPPPRRHWPRKRVIWALTAQTFLVMLGIGLVSPIMPLYAQSFGVSAAAVGGLITAFGVARIIMNVPVGTLSERFGRKPLLLAGPLIVSLAALLMALASEFNQLLLFRFLQGVGSAAQTTIAMTVLADITTSKDRGRVMSLYQGSLLVGQSFGPTVGGFVGGYFGYRAPFFLYSGLALLAAIWSYFVVPETRGFQQQAGGAAEGGSHAAATKERPKGIARELLLDRNFLLVGLVTFIIFFTRTGSRSTVLPLFGNNVLGLTTVQLGFSLTLMAIFNLLTVNLSGWLADHYGRKAAIVPACVVAGVALFTFTLCRSYAAFLASGALLGIATGLAGPAPAAYVADLAKPGQFGLTMGIYRTFGDVGVSIGPLLLGWISDTAGYDTALGLNAVLFAGAGLAFGLMARETFKPGQARTPTKRGPISI